MLEDRRKKGPMYAAAKIPVFWLLNLQTKRMEIYTDPQSGRDSFYRTRVELSAADVITLLLDGKSYGETKVKHLLG